MKKFPWRTTARTDHPRYDDGVSFGKRGLGEDVPCGTAGREAEELL